MGWVEYRIGNNEAAIEHLRRAWTLSRDPEIAAHLGEVLWVLGERDAARELWEKARAESPGNDVMEETVRRLLP